MPLTVFNAEAILSDSFFRIDERFVFRIDRCDRLGHAALSVTSVERASRRLPSLDPAKGMEADFAGASPNQRRVGC